MVRHTLQTGNNIGKDHSGTGCTFSSAIACNLALTSDKVQAVTNAKEYLAGAIAAKLDLGKGSGPLMHNYKIVEKDI